MEGHARACHGGCRSRDLCRYEQGHAGARVRGRQTDTKASALPVVDNKIDESALTPVDEIEDIAVGASPTLDVTLEAGHYVLLCNIETHYEQGMQADFDVS